MDTCYLPDQVRFRTMTTEEIRQGFLLDRLFRPGEVVLSYVDCDRTVVGSAVPAAKPLTLKAPAGLGADYFTERREIGVMNLGGKGVISVDGTEYPLANRDTLYIGRGSKVVQFSSDDPSRPAGYYLVSYPAHAGYPTRRARVSDAESLHLGSDRESNKRTIYKYIYPGGIESCQLVMGFTELAEGRVWNTMPAHRHARRMEVYLYFGLEDDAVVFHFMGPPRETRHVVVRDKQAVIAPSWSIHTGSGTRNYSFVWSMGGENQDFTDMDVVGMDELR